MITLNSPTLLLALLFAVLATWLAYRMGARSTQPRIAALEGKCETLSAQIDAHAQMDQTLKPLQHAMSTLADQVESAERARVSAISGLSEQVLGVGREVGAATKDVREQAHRITQALSRTQNQGTWGEMQLHRIVEASGMLEHVHFTEQTTVHDDDRHVRPDMIIELGHGRQVVVDAKVTLDAFLDPDLDPQTQAESHAAAVADHITRLSGKQYWKSVGTPEYVIMFLPAEHMLGVALQAKPGLLQTAFDRKVVLATPSTLMATLRSVSWAWQQAAMADQARAVLLAGQKVHDRLSTMSAHLTRLGKGLADAVTGYNQFVGSLDTRVMPSARRLAQMVAPESNAVEPTEIDLRPRTSNTLATAAEHGEAPEVGEPDVLEDTG